MPTPSYNVTFTLPNGKTKRVTRTYYTEDHIRREIQATWPGARFITFSRRSR